MDENKQIFSLRKLSVGLASVVIGTAFFASQGQSVKAAASTPESSVVTKSSVKSSTPAEARVNANQPGSAETESNQKPENIAERSIETSSTPQRGTNHPSNATTLNVANKNSKFFFTSKKLATNSMKKANSADASNGGFDTSWGKLDVNNWTLYDDGKHLNITGYTGSDHDHIIVPNGADFAKAGRNKNKLQTQISSDVTQTLKAKTVAFSKTDGQKTKLTDGYKAFIDDDIEKFDGSNLDVSNVTNMDHMFYSSFGSNNNNHISDLSSLAKWNVSNVTEY